MSQTKLRDDLWSLVWPNPRIPFCLLEHWASSFHSSALSGIKRNLIIFLRVQTSPVSCTWDSKVQKIFLLVKDQLFYSWELRADFFHFLSECGSQEQGWYCVMWSWSSEDIVDKEWVHSCDLSLHLVPSTGQAGGIWATATHHTSHTHARDQTESKCNRILSNIFHLKNRATLITPIAV